MASFGKSIKFMLSAWALTVATIAGAAHDNPEVASEGEETTSAKPMVKCGDAAPIQKDGSINVDVAHANAKDCTAAFGDLATSFGWHLVARKHSKDGPFQAWCHANKAGTMVKCIKWSEDTRKFSHMDWVPRGSDGKPSLHAPVPLGARPRVAGGPAAAAKPAVAVNRAVYVAPSPSGKKSVLSDFVNGRFVLDKFEIKGLPLSLWAPKAGSLNASCGRTNIEASKVEGDDYLASDEVNPGDKFKLGDSSLRFGNATNCSIQNFDGLSMKVIDRENGVLGLCFQKHMTDGRVLNSCDDKHEYTLPVKCTHRNAVTMEDYFDCEATGKVNGQPVPADYARITLKAADWNLVPHVGK